MERRTSFPQDQVEQPSPTQRISIPQTTQRMLRVPSPEHTRKQFCSNEIVTARYSIWTWAPKSLLWQFRRASNIYFLIICILSFQSFSAKRWDSMVGTFAIVLLMTMIKEAWEDFFRHRQDHVVNNTRAVVLDWTMCGFQTLKAKQLRVGDIIRVEENESFPADLLLIASADEKGIAFVETMNLDGETSLKDKSAVSKTKAMRTAAELISIDLELEYDPPKATLVEWNCNYSLRASALEALTLHNLLLRGCVLRDTAFIIGIVVYTGKDTKISLNSKAAPSKISNVLAMMNKMLYTIFVFQAAVCFLFAGLSVSWVDANSDKHGAYLEISGSQGATFVLSALTFLVAYSHMIPMSLYITMEILKLAQAYLIANDLDMYYEPDDRRACCRSSDLIEELGQVQFIFSDKTGTLTQNVMEFMECSIDGQVYQKEAATGRFVPAESKSDCGTDHFFEFLSLCHSVFASDGGDGEPKYQATSPDELALVRGAQAMDFVFMGKVDSTITIAHARTSELWKVLAEVPFSSSRKRMSIVLQSPRDSKVKLLCKGADSVILPLIRPSDDTSTVVSHLELFARKGLRTLVLAERELSPEMYAKWAETWREISLSSSVDKQQRLDSHASLLEADLKLIGATAIEDKLQVGVPETIKILLRADIRVWMLTGDKQETAIEIGKACSLLPASDNVLVLSSDSRETFAGNLTKLHEAYFPQTKYNLEDVRKSLKASRRAISLVIDGVTLEWVLNPDLGLRRMFYELGVVSSSCICCRVSPAQKMRVVQMVKAEGKWISLAIGDGANDVSMIQEANIGVGIAGKEGTQAVQAADYSLSQFRFLGKLLLVHGRWGYRRISFFICYYFYKNIVVVFAEISFAFFNGFSGQIYWADWFPGFYNTFWTSWPCIITFCYEQDISKQHSFEFPTVYRAGQLNRYFSVGRFWLWVLCAFFHGMVCFWVPMIGLDYVGGADGKATGLFWMSTLSFTLIMHTVSYKLLLESDHWTLTTILAIFLSLPFYYMWILLFCLDPIARTFQANLNMLVFKLLDTPAAWTVILFTPLVALLPDIGWKAWRAIYCPDPIAVLRARLKRHQVEERDLLTT